MGCLPPLRLNLEGGLFSFSQLAHARPPPPPIISNNKLDKNDNFYLESQSSWPMKIMFSNSSTHAD